MQTKKKRESVSYSRYITSLALLAAMTSTSSNKSICENRLKQLLDDWKQIHAKRATHFHIDITLHSTITPLQLWMARQSYPLNLQKIRSSTNIKTSKAWFFKISLIQEVKI